MDYAEASTPDGPSTVVPVISAQRRSVVRISMGGTRLRVKLSNLFGRNPVTFSTVSLAERPVTFGANASLTLAAGAEAWSDDVEQTVPRDSDVTVEYTLAAPADARTWHYFPWDPVYWLNAIAASGNARTNVVVAFGDSITDGSGASREAMSYPHQLSLRAASLTEPAVSVVSAGIGGNRWLYDIRGPSGASRFDRDVLGVTGVTHVIVLLGINDLILAPTLFQKPTLEQLIANTEVVVDKSHARGVKVLLGTLLPYKGVPLFHPTYEAMRQDYNNWVRSQRIADGVADFDAVLRNPADPAALAPAYDSGDHIHPNDLGYAAMAATVDIAKLR